MFRIALSLLLCLAPLTASLADPSAKKGAAPAPAPTTADQDVVTQAQAFYDGYMSVLRDNAKDSVAFVMKSPLVTNAFKKAFKAYMQQPDADPIICAQDFPDAGFTASLVSVEGSRATVLLTSKDATFQHSFKVFLTKGEAWKISGTQDLQPGGKS